MRRRSAGAAAVLLGLLALLIGRPAAAGQQSDRVLDEMLGRAEAAERPTPEDQVAAARALRDWQLSERANPSGDGRIGRLLQYIAAGEAPPDWARPVAAELRRSYLTDEGRAARARRMATGVFPTGASPLDSNADRLPETDAAGQWMLLLSCLVIMIGGVAVLVLMRRRRDRDFRSYYTP